jgi:glutathione-regulated potassium-efflux system ancillary protein KefG
MNKILILFGHPAFKRSTINAALRKAVENLEGITFHDLYGSYPDFLIDVTHEQKLCASHDIIVFQHPFYWYSTPAIISCTEFNARMRTNTYPCISSTMPILQN